MASSSRPFGRRFKKNLGRNAFILCGIIPVLVWVVLFAAYPMAIAMIRGFTNWSLASNRIDFIGLANFTRMPGDRVFTVALKNTVVAVVIVAPLSVILALLTAMAFNAVREAPRQIFTPIYFLPSVVSMVAIAAVWRWLYHSSYGLINYFLGVLGIPPQPFLRDPGQALASVLAMIVWQGIGYSAVILLAAIKNLPTVFYEAATIDGANSIQKFRHITVSLLTPNILFTSIMSVIGTFQVFVPISVMTGGGPGDASMVLAMYIYRVAINRLDLGYATAISMVLFVIIMVITVLQWKFVRSDWEY